MADPSVNICRYRHLTEAHLSRPWWEAGTIELDLRGPALPGGAAGMATGRRLLQKWGLHRIPGCRAEVTWSLSGPRLRVSCLPFAEPQIIDLLRRVVDEFLCGTGDQNGTSTNPARPAAQRASAVVFDELLGGATPGVSQEPNVRTVYATAQSRVRFGCEESTEACAIQNAPQPVRAPGSLHALGAPAGGGIEEHHVIAGMVTPGPAHPTWPALEVATYALVGSGLGALDARLRHASGESFGFRGRLESGGHWGLLVLSGRIASPSWEAAGRRVGQIIQAEAAALTREQVENAARAVAIGWAGAMVSSASAAAAARLELDADPSGDQPEYATRLASVSVGDVAQASATVAERLTWWVK